MEFQKFEAIVGVVFFGVVLLRAFRNFLEEIIFYKKNSWNFDLQFPRRLSDRTGYGAKIEFGNTFGSVPNSTRVVILYPIYILVLLIGAFGCFLFLLKH